MTRNSAIRSFIPVILGWSAPAAGTPCTSGSLCPPTPSAPYVWTISASHTDPLVQTATSGGGLETWYLWLVCSGGASHGMTAAEFGIQATNLVLVGFSPEDGFLNAGTGSDLLLAAGGCPGGPVVAGHFTTFGGPGTLCFAPSNAGGVMITADCTVPNPTAWPFAWAGLEVLPSDPNIGACCFPDGSCAPLDAASCASAGGTFRGAGTNCLFAQCPPPPPPPTRGACCYPNGACVDSVDSSACVQAGGIYRGAGTTCATAPCHPTPLGAYGWAISASEADPHVNSTKFTPGIQFAYLWLLCSEASGMTSAQFRVASSSPGNLVFEFDPMNGFLNAGTSTDLFLAVGACPVGPVVAGMIRMFVQEPGTLCITADGTGTEVTGDCWNPSSPHSIHTTGLAFGGTPCASSTCSVLAVQETTWGRIKNTYR